MGWMLGLSMRFTCLSERAFYLVEVTTLLTPGESGGIFRRDIEQAPFSFKKKKFPCFRVRVSALFKLQVGSQSAKCPFVMGDRLWNSHCLWRWLLNSANGTGAS